MTVDNWGQVDWARSASLGDVGAPDHLAAIVITPDGTSHFLVALHDGLGDANVRYDADCLKVIHEQLGPLPLDVVRRIAIAKRNQRRHGGWP